MNLQPPSHFLSAIGHRDNWELIIRSPGRINVIGEHTDYNGGLVLPAAIEQAIYFAARPSKDNLFHFTALDIEERVTVSEIPASKNGPTWFDYISGVIQTFQHQGFNLPPVEVVFGGNLPQGAGVSSSAALEGGMAFLCNTITQAGFSRPELAQICKTSSNQYMGIPSGIMDQFASLNGQAGKAMLLNCANLDHEFVDIDIPGHQFLLVNSMVSHELSNSAYADRVAECQTALSILQNHHPDLEVLATATPEMVDALIAEMPEKVFKRARYVSTESKRIQRAILALKSGNAVALGNELNATHAGLRDDYEVSCPETDFLQSFAQSFDGVAGSRMMGGGFGGCTINLIKVGKIEAFSTSIQRAYRNAFGIEATIFPARIAAGTTVVI